MPEPISSADGSWNLWQRIGQCPRLLLTMFMAKYSKFHKYRQLTVQLEMFTNGNFIFCSANYRSTRNIFKTVTATLHFFFAELRFEITNSLQTFPATW